MTGCSVPGNVGEMIIDNLLELDYKEETAKELFGKRSNLGCKTERSWQRRKGIKSSSYQKQAHGIK